MDMDNASAERLAEEAPSKKPLKKTAQPSPKDQTCEVGSKSRPYGDDPARNSPRRWPARAAIAVRRPQGALLQRTGCRVCYRDAQSALRSPSDRRDAPMQARVARADREQAMRARLGDRRVKAALTQSSAFFSASCRRSFRHAPLGEILHQPMRRKAGKACFAVRRFGLRNQLVLACRLNSGWSSARSGLEVWRAVSARIRVKGEEDRRRISSGWSSARSGLERL